jgi:hypothetical protein
MEEKEEKEEKMELSHEPVPGYRPTFYIIFAVSLIYLAIIFIRS